MIVTMPGGITVAGYLFRFDAQSMVLIDGQAPVLVTLAPGMVLRHYPVQPA